MIANENIKIAAIVPTKNEAACIGKLVDCLNGYVDRTIVIDGNSSDKTPEIAEYHGAEVFNGKGIGKGYDLKMFQEHIQKHPIDSDILVMMDGDMTNDPEEISKMIKPIKKGEADVVIGTRLGCIKQDRGSMRRLGKFGNIVLAQAARFLYQRNDITDVTTGYWAFSKDFLRGSNISAKGWDLETDMLDSALRNYRLEVVPVKYHRRKGYSKLRPLDACKLPLYLFKYFALGKLRTSESK